MAIGGRASRGELLLLECEGARGSGRGRRPRRRGKRRAMRVALVAVAIGAVAALAAGACGSSGGRHLSPEEYTTAANAICKHANERIDALPDPQTKDELVAYIRQARTIGDDELSALRQLSQPAEIADRVDEMVGLLEQQLAL